MACALLLGWTLGAQAQTKATRAKGVPSQTKAVAAAAQARPKSLGQLPTQGEVKIVKFAPVGSLLASLCELPAKGSDPQDMFVRHDWQLRVWDTRTRKVKWSVVRPDILAFDFSPDGKRLVFLEATAKVKSSEIFRHEGQVLQVHEALSGKAIRSIPAADESWSNDGWDEVRFALDNRTVFMSATSEKKRQYTNAKGEVISGTLSDGLRGVWFDTLSGERLRSTRIPRYFKDDSAPPFVEVEYLSDSSLYSYDLMMSPDNKTLIVDVETYQESAPLYRESSRSSQTGSNAKRIHHLWLCNVDGIFERQLTSTTHLTQGFSPDGALFMCSDERHRVQIFDVRQGKLLHTLGVPNRYSLEFGDSSRFFQFTSGLFSRDGKRVYVTIMNDGKDGDEDDYSQVGEWDLKSGRVLRLIGMWKPGYISSSIALSGDDTILAHPINPGPQLYDHAIQLWKLK